MFYLNENLVYRYAHTPALGFGSCVWPGTYVGSIYTPALGSASCVWPDTYAGSRQDRMAAQVKNRSPNIPTANGT